MMGKIKAGGNDIDIVQLEEVDAEVVERCESLACAAGLEFATDTTLVRDPSAEQYMLEPPTKGMPAFSCKGFQYVLGEWPAAEGAAPATRPSRPSGAKRALLAAKPTKRLPPAAKATVDDEWDEDDSTVVIEEEAPGGSVQNRAALAQKRAAPEPDDHDEYVEIEEEELWAETGQEKIPAGLTLEPGAEIEAYWPEDDTWLPATVIHVLTHGQVKISWASDGSSSNVPADYVREPVAGESSSVPNLSKRRRTGI